MNETDTPPSTDGAATDAVRALASENAALVAQLRAAQIPQHVGMAAACRALAADLPRELARELEADLASGALAARWEAVRVAAAEASSDGDVEATLAAVAVLLREQTRAVMRHLASRAKEWTADAYRLEGQAATLEHQTERLRQIAGAAAPLADADVHAVTDADDTRSDTGTAG